MKLEVEDEIIESVVLCRPRFWMTRLDVLPFAVLYLILFSPFLLGHKDLFVLKSSLFAIPIVLLAQLALFLVVQFSIDLQAFVGHYKVQEISQALTVLVRTTKNSGNSSIVTLFHRQSCPKNPIDICGQTFYLEERFFEFQKLIYEFDQKTKSFRRVNFPSTISVKSVMKYVGLKDSTSIEVGERIWGLNKFNIPLPLFLDLYLVGISIFCFYMCFLLSEFKS